MEWVDFQHNTHMLDTPVLWADIYPFLFTFSSLARYRWYVFNPLMPKRYFVRLYELLFLRIKQQMLQAANTDPFKF